MADHRAAKTIAETQVVVMNLRFSFGSTGDDGSPPPGTGMPISAWLRVPSGRMANKAVHQIVR